MQEQLPDAGPDAIRQGRFANRDSKPNQRGMAFSVGDFLLRHTSRESYSRESAKARCRAAGTMRPRGRGLLIFVTRDVHPRAVFGCAACTNTPNSIKTEASWADLRQRNQPQLKPTYA